MPSRRLFQPGQDVVLLNPHTCGVYKDGGVRYQVDPATGKRSSLVDDELNDHVDAFMETGNAPGMVRVSAKEALRRRVLAPRYYDDRYAKPLRDFLSTAGLEAVSLGELIDQRIITIRAGHGSPSNDARRGTIPYIKVSDIRALRVNVNPTNLVSRGVAESKWRGKDSGLKAWDLISPIRASSNIGEFAVLLPGEEQVVLTKEMCVLRVASSEDALRDGWDPFYMHWALCLAPVRNQWRRIALMQTNREDVGQRYREILLPKPPSAAWAAEASEAFRTYFESLSTARQKFVEAVDESGYSFIPSVHSVGTTAVTEEEAAAAAADTEEEDSSH